MTYSSLRLSRNTSAYTAAPPISTVVVKNGPNEKDLVIENHVWPANHYADGKATVSLTGQDDVRRLLQEILDSRQVKDESKPHSAPRTFSKHKSKYENEDDMERKMNSEDIQKAFAFLVTYTVACTGAVAWITGSALQGAAKVTLKGLGAVWNLVGEGVQDESHDPLKESEYSYSLHEPDRTARGLCALQS